MLLNYTTIINITIAKCIMSTWLLIIYLYRTNYLPALCVDVH